MGTMEELENAVKNFLDFAKKNRNKIFLLTKIGCGIANKDENEIKKLFGINTPINILLPKEWETRKYISTGETKLHNNSLVHRIVALREIKNNYKLTDKFFIGGWIESEMNMSQEGECFIYDECIQYQNSYRKDNAVEYGNSRQFGYSQQYGSSCQSGNSQQYGNSRQYGSSRQYGNSQQYGSSCQSGNSQQYG